MPERKTPTNLLQGRYRLGRTLGAGGMATVYEAFDETLRVTRAIKLLNAPLAKNEKIVARFVSEARTMAQLRHPNIVNVFDVSMEGDQPFIVMEYMQGGSLMDLVDEGQGGVEPRAACLLTAGLLRGLDCAHKSGVVHRDVKPHNVLLDEEGVPKVTDFGIARVKNDDSHLTKTGMVMGTLAYMPPEQRQSARQVDARSDVYAAGATLYVLAKGLEPFDLYATEFHDRLFKGMHPDVAAIVKVACRYEMDDRFQSAEEMALALDALVASMTGTGDGLPMGAGGALAERASERVATASRTSETQWLHDDDDGDAPPRGGLGKTLAPSSTPLPGERAPGRSGAVRPLQGRRKAAGLGLVAALLLVGVLSYFGVTQDPGGLPAGEPTAPAASAELEAPTVPSSAEPAAVAGGAAEPLAEPFEPEGDAAEKPEQASREAQPSPPAPEAEAPAPAASSPRAPARRAPAASAPAPAETPPREERRRTAEPKEAVSPPPATAAAPAVAAPAAAAPTETGTVVVNSRPWSTVSEGGAILGRTGWKGTLPAGPHALTLTTADGRTHTLTVEVAANGRTSTCWSFDLNAACPR